MMYPFLQIDGDTEIVHSEMQPDGEVKVYIEKPDAKDGFHHATSFLPECRWEDVSGFSEREIARFQEVLESTAHLIIEFSREGALPMPQVFKIGPYWVYFWANERSSGTDPCPCGRGRARGQWHKDLDHQGGEMSALQQCLQDPRAGAAEYYAHHRSPEF